MRTLDELAIFFGTDKGTKHPHAGHGYAPHYDRLFNHLRDEPIKMLEIGIGGGESIKMWLEYFDKASVFGVDNVRDTNPWNTPGHKEHDRYTPVYGDQSSETFWQCFLADYGSDWDIIIDDGGHFSNQIITTFNALWPTIRRDGFYAIEDLAVCIDPGTIFVPAGSPNHLDWIKGKMKEIITGDDSYRLDFSRELAVFCKTRKV